MPPKPGSGGKKTPKSADKKGKKGRPVSAREEVNPFEHTITFDLQVVAEPREGDPEPATEGEQPKTPETVCSSEKFLLVMLDEAS